jgi:DNA invertase Pin-like site-specific DNA recombinase|tara:strand:+ start:300 stop:548 length:249 start_codon:yes stop_codon:yes gene_type:complete
MALSKTAKYYRDNPKARIKHRISSAKAQKKKAAVRKRVECNLWNKKNKNSKKGDNKDCSHKNGKLVLESQKKNRARGGGKKK